jgi:hypothetical protein
VCLSHIVSFFEIKLSFCQTVYYYYLIGILVRWNITNWTSTSGTGQSLSLVVVYYQVLTCLAIALRPNQTVQASLSSFAKLCFQSAHADIPKEFKLLAGRTCGSNNTISI